MKKNVSSPDSAPTMPQNPLLVPEASDPTLARLLLRSTSELADATRPSFLANGHSPVQWSRSDWDRLEANREPLFDMSAVAAQFDHASFSRDGYAVLREVMTPQTVAEWTAALKYGQQLNDRLLKSDWTQIDWQILGRTPPTQSLTVEQINNAIGGSQKAPQSDDAAGVKTLRQHSVFAEYFPAGHVPYLMNVLTHPQMLQLQRMSLGSDDIYFDHNQLLTRPPGYPGGAWHSHKVGAGADNCGVASLSEYQAQPNFNLTLCYPQGFEAEDDGGLKIIRGSHLLRDPAGCWAEHRRRNAAGLVGGTGPSRHFRAASNRIHLAASGIGRLLSVARRACSSFQSFGQADSLVLTLLLQKTERCNRSCPAITLNPAGMGDEGTTGRAASCSHRAVSAKLR